jgi:hypothetical protein
MLIVIVYSIHINSFFDLLNDGEDALLVVSNEKNHENHASQDDRFGNSNSQALEEL